MTLLWKSLPGKLRLYEALYTLNRCFEATLLSLKKIEDLGIFRHEYLSETKVALERTRAETNEELTETLHDYEMDESVHFEELHRSVEQERKDPDDVFFEANARKQQIKDQMRTLQRSLGRQRPKRKRRSAR